MQIIVSGTEVLGVRDWVRGFTPVRRPRRCLTEEQVLAHALYLQRTVSVKAALEFIEQWTG